MAQVRLENVSKIFGKTPAVRDVSLTVEDGEFLTLLGPSGCGKTTTLNLIAGLESPTQGKIFFDGEVVNHLSPRQRNVAVVFQNYALYPHKTVFENVAFPLRMRDMGEVEIGERVMETARLLGIEELLAKRPRALSGGQQQRVALGRALVRHPLVFLLDEPLSNLDAPLRAGMRRELKELHDHVGITFIYVTHDQEEAMLLSDRIAAMFDGTILQCAPPQEMYRSPFNTTVAAFVGNPPINLVPGEVQGNFLHLAGCEVAFSLRVVRSTLPPRVTVGIRPEHISVSPMSFPGSVPAVVDRREYVGKEGYLHLSHGPIRLMARTVADISSAPGDVVYWYPEPEKLLFFDLATGRNLAQGEGG